MVGMVMIFIACCANKVERMNKRKYEIGNKQMR
jgi:hypothetical protein